jgi:uncharacterized membrane protein
MWLIPMGFVLLAIFLAWFMPRLDRNIGIEPPFTYSPSAAQTTLSAIASGMLVFTGFVFSILTFAIQFGSSSFTPRLLRSIAMNTQVKVALGVFVATFFYALLLLADIAPFEAGYVPQFSMLLAVVLVGVSILEFLRLIVEVTDSSRSGRVISGVGRNGREVISAAFPLPATSAAPPAAERHAPDEAGHVVVCPRAGGGVLQAMNTAGLLAAASDARVVVELVPAIGDYVPTGATVFRVYGGTTTPSAPLLGNVAFGDERTYRQDPSYPLRILVDIALKALSPAINDPTTAVEALGRLGDLLVLLASRQLPDGVLRDDAGEVRFFYRTPSWDEYLKLALDEIRIFGATTPSVEQQMRQLLGYLEASVPEWRREAVVEQLRLLDAAVER